MVIDATFIVDLTSITLLYMKSKIFYAVNVDSEIKDTNSSSYGYLI